MLHSSTPRFAVAKARGLGARHWPSSYASWIAASRPNIINESGKHGEF